jgi:hypothetical protein
MGFILNANEEGNGSCAWSGLGCRFFDKLPFYVVFSHINMIFIVLMMNLIYIHLYFWHINVIFILLFHHIIFLKKRKVLK